MSTCMPGGSAICEKRFGSGDLVREITLRELRDGVGRERAELRCLRHLLDVGGRRDEDGGEQWDAPCGGDGGLNVLALVG